jgi:hypothetical protein
MGTTSLQELAGIVGERPRRVYIAVVLIQIAVAL